MTNHIQSRIATVAVLWLVVAASCETAILCSAVSEPAVVVVVEDAVTRLPIAEGAWGFVQDGAYVDTLSRYGSLGDGTEVSLRAADERPGTYRVVVKRQGYVDWSRNGIAVTKDECHVRTVTVTASMDSLRSSI